MPVQAYSAIYFEISSGIEEYSLIKLMISHDLPRSTVTNQIIFDQQDSNSILDFERAMDRRCQVLETLDTITFT